MTNSFRKSILTSAVIAVLYLLVGGGGAATADLVIYSTGVDDSGNVLAAGAADTHYTVSKGTYTGRTSLSVLPNTGLTAYVVNNPTGLTWAGNTTRSAWISPVAGGSGSPGRADYIYTTTFDLTGLNFATASLDGVFSGDDGVTVYLNQTRVADYRYIPGSNAPWKDLPAFSITTGFKAGINTLQFVVPNSGGPGGLQFQVTGGTLANLPVPSPVPEPTTWASALMGAVVVAGISRRRKNS